MPPPIVPNLHLTQSFLYDAVILGAGPAGLSAALALCRVRRTTVVFSTPEFRNTQAHRAHTILSRDHTPPAEIRAAGRRDIDRYGTTKFVERAITTARKLETENMFEAIDQDGEKWRGRKIILAMGSKDILPTDIEGYAECWGYDIYQCLFCDGIERSDKPAGLLGFPSPMYLHNVSNILQMGCPSVTIFGNGPLEPDEKTAEALKIAKAKGAKIDERKIKKLIHLDDEQGIKILFEDGTSANVGFLAHKPETVVNAPALVEGLGVEVVPDGMGGTMVKTIGPFNETNVKGVSAAGDIAVFMKQFTKAMFDGVAAGGGAHMQLCMEEDERVATELKGIDEEKLKKMDLKPEAMLTSH